MNIRRLPGFRFNRGRIPAAMRRITPLTILGSSVLQWCRSDLGITIGTGVSAWADQSGNGLHYTRATGADQPAYSTTSGPNNTPGLTFDGVSDSMTSSLNLPAPGTTPTYLWMIVKQVSWTNGERLVDGQDTTARHRIAQTAGASPDLVANNGTASSTNAGAAVGSFVRLEAGFSNATSDFLKCGSTEVTGTALGNNSSTGRRIATNGSGTNFANIVVSEIFYANRIPTAAERAALNAYCTARYGAGLV